jgi:hypothetical protein
LESHDLSRLPVTCSLLRSTTGTACRVGANRRKSPFMVLIVHTVPLPRHSFTRACSASSSGGMRVGHPSISAPCPVPGQYIARAARPQGAIARWLGYSPTMDSNRKGRPAARYIPESAQDTKGGLRLTQSAGRGNACQSAADRLGAVLETIKVKLAHPRVGNEYTPGHTRIFHGRTAAVHSVTYDNVSVCGGHFDASTIVGAASRLPPLEIVDLWAAERHLIPPVA